MIAQTEAKDQWQPVCLVECQSLLADKNDYGYLSSSSFKKVSSLIWMTARSSHSNDSIHSKLESFGQLQA